MDVADPGPVVPVTAGSTRMVGPTVGERRGTADPLAGRPLRIPGTVAENGQQADEGEEAEENEGDTPERAACVDGHGRPHARHRGNVSPLRQPRSLSPGGRPPEVPPPGRGTFQRTDRSFASTKSGSSLMPAPA